MEGEQCNISEMWATKAFVAPPLTIFMFKFLLRRIELKQIEDG